jgi:hypothetical protein
MFLRLFRTEFSFQLILLLVMGLLLWLPAFLNPLPLPMRSSPVPVYDWMIDPLRSHLLLATILAFILLLSESVILALVLSAFDLAPKSSGMSAIIFFLLSSWQTETLNLHPVLISNIFFIIFLNYFLKVNDRTDPFKEVFSAAFTLSLACIFTFSAFPLFLVMWFGFFVYRILSWREWFISILGFLLPFLFALTWFFWFDRLDEVNQDLISRLHFPVFTAHLGYFKLIIWGGIAFLSLGALFRTLSIIREKVISIRKNFLFMAWFFLISLLVLLNYANDITYVSLVPLLPASALIAYHFTSLKKTLWWDIYFSILFVMIFLTRLQ